MTIIGAGERFKQWDSLAGQSLSPPEPASADRIFGAALRLVNPLFSMRESIQTVWNYFLPPSDYDPIPDIPDEMLEFAGSYWKARNKEDVDRITGVIRQELEDETVLQNSGWQGLFLTFAAGATDPLQYLIPGSLLFKIAKTGKRISPLLTAGRFALGGAVSNIPSEIALQLGLPEYTAEQSALNTLAAGVLTGGLGYASGHLSRWADHVNEIADTLREHAGLPPQVALTPEIREMEGLPPARPRREQPGQVLYNFDTGKVEILSPEKIPAEAPPVPEKRYVYRNGLMFRADADLIEGDYVIVTHQGVKDPADPVPTPAITPREVDTIVDSLGPLSPEEVNKLIQSDPDLATYAAPLRGEILSNAERLRQAGVRVLGDEITEDFGAKVFMAAKLKDGTIFFDTEAGFHGALMPYLENAGIHADEIIDTGFVYKNKYYSPDEFSEVLAKEKAAEKEKIAQTKKKVAEAKSKAEKKTTEIMPEPEILPGTPRIESSPEGFRLILPDGNAYVYFKNEELTTFFETLEEAQMAAKTLGIDPELPKTAKPAVAETPAAPLEPRVFDAYLAETGGKDRTRVRLADFRKHFPDMSKEELDAELKRMMLEDKIILYRQDDPRQIKAADREAVLEIAGVPHHIIIIEGEKMGKSAPMLKDMPLYEREGMPIIEGSFNKLSNSLRRRVQSVLDFIEKQSQYGDIVKYEIIGKQAHTIKIKGYDIHNNIKISTYLETIEKMDMEKGGE